MNHALRIIGIDPGSRCTGVAILEQRQSSLFCLHHQTIRLDQEIMSDRLALLHQSIVELIVMYRPQEMAIESVFVSRNAASALKLGQARGVAMCAGALSGLSVSEYSPRAIKLAVVGSGAAQKEQVQHMVRCLLNLQSRPQSDAADAMAIAICHVHERQTQQKMKRLAQYI